MLDFLGLLKVTASLVQDSLYDVVYDVGGSALDFTEDLLRGTTYSNKRERLKTHIDRKERLQKPEKPLTYNEKMIFADMLKRTPGEDQINYWKRKKALLNSKDKKNLVAQQIALEKHRENRKKSTHKIVVDAPSFTHDYQKNLAAKQRTAQKAQKR